jgi:hypothetical protein
MKPRYFEDFHVGDEIASSRYTLTPTEIIQFRGVYGGDLGSAASDDLDPARLHVDLSTVKNADRVERRAQAVLIE